MKPRTKLEKLVVKSMKRLQPLSDYAERLAIKQVAIHYAKFNSKKQYTCLDCGHVWKGEKSDHVKCPNCKTKLEVVFDRKFNYISNDYFMTITTCNGFQVLRMYLMRTILKKGKKSEHFIFEAWQRWITEDGKSIIASRLRNQNSYYADVWNYGSSIEIRKENWVHSMEAYKIIGKKSILPKLKRNGFTGDFHRNNPSYLLPELLANNKTETLWKIKKYEIVRQILLSNNSCIDKYWKQLMIALRHNYQIDDYSLWKDTVDMLSTLGKDIRNPKIFCPDNLKDVHDRISTKVRAIREAENRKAKREAYLQDVDRVQTDENNYQSKYGKYLSLCFVDNEIVIKPLASVLEFMKEGDTMNHCVFSNRYYEKNNTLILHALINNLSIATIELDLKTMEIAQCRGAHNSIPQHKDRIVSLLKQNINKIAHINAA